VVNRGRVAAENVSASTSRITDPDTALRLAGLARDQITRDPGTALLAQADRLPDSVVKLLQ
jgi:flagellin